MKYKASKAKWKVSSERRRMELIINSYTLIPDTSHASYLTAADRYTITYHTMSYCSYVNGLSAEEENVHRDYHNNHYGFPIGDDNELFCRLILEINQAGLSWTTILKKEQGFRKAYHNFNIARIAKYADKDRERLLHDAGIIRNRLKVNAAIENARAVLQLQKEFGSFKNWIEHHHPKTKEEWMKLFKATFKFTGGEIVNEFLLSTGYLPGAHTPDCPVYKKTLKSKPAWNR